MKKILSIIFSILLIFQMVVLATPWDVSTASYDSVSKSVGAQDGTPSGVVFKPDGTKMYIMGYSSDTVYQYSLSTAWNVGTASYDSISKAVGSQDRSPRGIDFKSDGTKMYILGYSSDTVYQYSLPGEKGNAIFFGINY
jgi:DNA-binding beta-propeller fold protein YncE